MVFEACAGTSSNEPAILIKRGWLGSGKPEELTRSREARATGSEIFPRKKWPKALGSQIKSYTPPPLLQHQGMKGSIECVHLLKQAQVKSAHQDGGLALHYGMLIIITSNGN